MYNSSCPMSVTLSTGITSANIYWQWADADATADITHRPNFRYSFDKINWNDFSWTNNKTVILTLTNAQPTVYIEGNNTALAYDWNEGLYTSFMATDHITMGGNACSLLADEGTVSAKGLAMAFSNFDAGPYFDTVPDVLASTIGSYGLFEYAYCSGIQRAPRIRPKAISESAFQLAFGYCTNLTTAKDIVLYPENVPQQGYGSMFIGCANLVTGPRILGHNFANSGAYCMFSNCSKLANIPVLYNVTADYYGMAYMFLGCESLTRCPIIGTAEATNDYAFMYLCKKCSNITSASELTFVGSIYIAMCWGAFDSCVNLLTPPQIDCTGVEFKNYCFKEMFNGCAKITYLQPIFAHPILTIYSFECFKNMYAGTGLKVSTTQDETYSEPWVIMGRSVASSSFQSMFSGTKGTFTGDPGLNTSYYLPKNMSTTKHLKVNSKSVQKYNTIHQIGTFNGYDIQNKAIS